jgi:hypothetical protein
MTARPRVVHQSLHVRMWWVIAVSALVQRILGVMRRMGLQERDASRLFPSFLSLICFQTWLAALGFRTRRIQLFLLGLPHTQ